MLLRDNLKLLDKIDMVTSAYLPVFDCIKWDVLSSNTNLCIFQPKCFVSKIRPRPLTCFHMQWKQTIR